MRAERSRAAGLVCAAAFALPLHALAQAAAPYPFTQDQLEVSRWLKAQTDAPPGGLVGIDDGRAFVLTPRSADPGATASGPDGATDAVVQVEALTPRAAALMHGRSMRIEAQVRCADRQVQLAETSTFAGARQAGAAVETRRGPGYAAAPTGSMLDRVVDKVCGRSSTIAAAAPAAPPIPAEPPVGAEPPANPAGAPEAAAPPASEPASGASAPAEVAAPSPARSAHAGGGASAQIGAFPSAEDADTAWRKAQGLASSGGLRLRIEPVKSASRTLYRALVEGFPSRDAAQAFCSALKTAGRPCLVRR